MVMCLKWLASPCLLYIIYNEVYKLSETKYYFSGEINDKTWLHVYSFHIAKTTIVMV